ncbi:hypothetical protein ACIRL2_41285 [Embleya sp. NPDC127516]|uniref:hypothetical protein n=1 Tax=Embleya sp. NPDC127516 TaxID=3363990 RepID=UPI00382624B9
MPAVRTDGEVTDRTPDRGAVQEVAQVHAAGVLPTDPSGTNREGCWDLLGPRTRERLEAQAGGRWAWWGELDEDEYPEVFVFGPLGMCRAASVVREGRRVYLVERVRFEPDALIRRSFHRDAPDPRGRTSRFFRPRRPVGDTPVRDSSSTPAVPADLGLDDRDSGVLGNLPARVQEFLQQPFLGEDQGVVAKWYYAARDGETDRQTWIVFALMGDRDVTVASGVRTVPHRVPLERAGWELDYYHAPVRRPRPAP